MPTEASCLNCGEEYSIAEESCPGCGLTREAAAVFLQLPETVERSAVGEASQAFHQGLFQHGLALLNRLLQQDVRVTEAWLLKYRFYRRLGFVKAAKTTYEGAVELGAPADMIHLYGATLRAQGFDSQAIEAFQWYLDSAPEDPQLVAAAYSEQGNALTRLGKYPEAENAHQQAISAMPSYALLHLNYADTLIKQRKWGESLQTVYTGLSYAQDADEKSALLTAKAQILAAQLRGEEALSCVTEAIALGANSAAAYYIRGRTLAMLGRLKEARQAMARVLVIDPGNADAQLAIRQINDALDN